MQVEPKDSFRHEISYIFLFSGQFKIEVICSGYDAALAQKISHVDQSANCYKYQEQQLRTEVVMSSTKSGSASSAARSSSQSSSSFISGHNQQSTGMGSGPSLWKITPSLEINVSV